MKELNALSTSARVLGLLIMVSIAFNKLMPICTVLLLLTLIWDRASKNEAFTRLKSPMMILAGIYILHIIGMTYSQNTDFGWMDIGMKASFVIFPSFFLFTGIKITRRQTENLILLGLFVALAYSELMALYKFSRWPVGLAYFRGSYFSILMHRSYFGVYLFFGLLLSSVRLLENLNFKNKQLYLSLFFAIGAIQTFSKLALILVVLYSVCYLAYLIIVSKRKIVISGVAILLIVGLFVGINSSKYLTRRLNSTWTSMTADKKDTNKTESNNARIEMWKTSSGLILESPIFGYGTGDVKDQLIARNIEKGNFELAEKKLNAHNQFLNIGVALGTIGILLLCSWLFSLIILFHRLKLRAWQFFVIAIILTFLTESFLETQAGIMPISLYLCLPIIFTDYSTNLIIRSKK